MEGVQEVRVTSPESRLRAETPGSPEDRHFGVQARATSFEPEVLAFCCEH